MISHDTRPNHADYHHGRKAYGLTAVEAVAYMRDCAYLNRMSMFEDIDWWASSMMIFVNRHDNFHQPEFVTSVSGVDLPHWLDGRGEVDYDRNHPSIVGQAAEVVRDAFTDNSCAECGQLFTHDEWDGRHTRPDGEDVHVRCCAECKAEPRVRPLRDA